METIKGGEIKAKCIFGSQLARVHVGEEKNKKKKRKEEEKKEEEGGGEEEDQGMFVLESSVFWIPRALIWRLVAPLV